MRTAAFVVAVASLGLGLGLGCSTPARTPPPVTGECEPGATQSCYDGPDGTDGVGACHHGDQLCSELATWGACAEVVPAPEVCGNTLDDNCNGRTDEDEDLDNDGITTCAGDCCDSTGCAHPESVQPGAFEVADNQADDDCDGVVDNANPTCDAAIASDTNDAMAIARAVDLCQVATADGGDWGVITAALSLADGTGLAADASHAVRPRYGTNGTAQRGASLVMLSSGAAAVAGDQHPSVSDFNGSVSGFPADFFHANGDVLPNVEGCPPADGDTAQDSVMLTMQIRVPTNARSFTLRNGFYSTEFPEFTCTRFNDFFVILLDSSYVDPDRPNPADKNLAIYKPAGTTLVYPVGVNLAYGDTGLFTQCVNGETGCAGDVVGLTSACTGTDLLIGTGLDARDEGACDSDSLVGGGTGWLTTGGNVVPGEIITLRVAIWDTSDSKFDSTAVLDAFTWSTGDIDPGTIFE